MFVRRSGVDWENVVQIIDHFVANGIKDGVEELLFHGSGVPVAHLGGEMEVIARMRSERSFGDILGVDANLIERLDQVDFRAFGRASNFVDEIIRMKQRPNQGFCVLVACASEILNMSKFAGVFLGNHMRGRQREVCRRSNDDAGTQLEFDVLFRRFLVVFQETIKRSHPWLVDLDWDTMIDGAEWREYRRQFIDIRHRSSARR